jgi:hypothetical protein
MAAIGTGGTKRWPLADILKLIANRSAPGSAKLTTRSPTAKEA